MEQVRMRKCPKVSCAPNERQQALLCPTSFTRRESEGKVFRAADSFLTLAEFQSREKQVVTTLNELQQQAQTVMDVISNPEVVAALRQDKLHNLTYLKDTHNVSFGVLTCFRAS